MTAAPARKTVDVAVGVLIRPDGKVLLADRPVGKPYAGYWEFPGGKVEAGETVAAALARELHEELGIEIGPSVPWVVFEHDYPHAYVRLHFRRVFEWRGEPFPREGQRVGFYSPTDGLPAGLPADRPAGLPAPLLPATLPVLRWFELPALYAISNIAGLGVAPFFAAFEAALQRGLRLLLLREPQLSDEVLNTIVPALRERAHAVGARVLVSSRHAPALWEMCDGVQLTARDLLRAPSRPAVKWVAASVHNRVELTRASGIGCDFAVLGSVLPTASHPGSTTLGWDGFAAIAQQTPLPLYAIGGLRLQDLHVARAAGAHGIALLRAAWQG